MKIMKIKVAKWGTPEKNKNKNTHGHQGFQEIYSLVLFVQLVFTVQIA
jgi:hypothetical protein